MSARKADEDLFLSGRTEEDVQEEMNKVIILLGPTGAGKTGVSLLLAKELGTEIISADSMQIYRHMDIGTAKPTRLQRSVVTHHMIDIIGPHESFSTGQYIRMVSPVIEELHREGRIPVVVGGTGLYIKAMTRGIFSGPSADWPLREKLRSMEKKEAGSLYASLKELDPVTAAKITANDSRRIIRALEVCIKGSNTISAMQENFTRPLPFEFIKVGLKRDRKELYNLIEGRVDEMMLAGLVDEVRTVMKQVSVYLNHRVQASPLPSLQAIGYKEIAQFLNGFITLDEAVSLIKRNTKRYAKRQFTWFSKEEGIHWVDATGVHDSNEICRNVCKIIKGSLVQ